MTDLSPSLLDQVASGILILDAEGSVCTANAAARDLLPVRPSSDEAAANGTNEPAAFASTSALFITSRPHADAPLSSGASRSAPRAFVRSRPGSQGPPAASSGTRTARRSSGHALRSPQESAAPPERIATLTQRALQNAETITRTGCLFVAPATGDRASRRGASHQDPSSGLTVPADAPLVRLTLRPDPSADRVVATIEPLPDPSPSAGRPQKPSPKAEPSHDGSLRGGSSRSGSSRAEPPSHQALPAYVRILEAIAKGESAASTATSVSAMLEERVEGLTAVVMRYDTSTKTLRHLTSPSLDPASHEPLRDGLPIQECALCRTAVQEQSRQHHDLTDNDWVQVINSAWYAAFDEADARMCLTVPIMRDTSDVLGVIVLLFEIPQRYADTDPALIETAVQLIHIALERDKRAHDLSERTERLRQMTETMQEVFWLRTRDELLHASASFSDVWGRPVEDLYDNPDIYMEDVHPGDLDRVSDACNRLLYEGEPISLDYRIIRRSDGETRWVRVNFRPVDNEVGPARFAGTVRDATDEITSQMQLEMSEQTYRNLIDHASDAIYVQNVDGRFVDLSAGAVEMYGYSREELLGQTPAFVSAPGKNNLDRIQHFFDAALDGEPQQFEFWGQRADGSIFPKEVRLQKATYFGEPVVVAFALDISTRVAAEEALRESEQRYRLVVKNMKDMVMLHDAEGGTLWVSPSVREVTGRTPEEAIKLGAFDVIHPDDQERVVHHLAMLHEGVNLGPIIYRIRHNDGHYIWVETLVQATYSDDGALERIQSASRDVTERKRQQEELREAKRNAEDADRLKSAMLANMSHEIRTPLTSVIGFAELLKDEVDPSYQQFAGLIYDSSRRLMRTLDSVLQLSKLEAGLVDIEVSPVDLQQELRETVDLMRPQAQRKSIDLCVDDLDEIAVTGVWDGGAMHRILTNLVGNAIKFTGDGGSVRLSAETRAGRVYIRVADTGVGIDPAFMPHLFEPFKQETGGMRRSYEGTGLGLAIVQRLVEMMGGTIDVESEKGRGTTFTVILPLDPQVVSASVEMSETA